MQTPSYPSASPDFMTHYKSEMERNAIAQAQDFLRRYGLFPPPGSTVEPSTAAPQGDLVTIPVSSQEQVTAAPIDAFRTFLYPNFANREIYVKKMGVDGKEEITVYLPKGHEAEKAHEETSRKVIEALAAFDTRLKGIEDKYAEQSKL